MPWRSAAAARSTRRRAGTQDALADFNRAIELNPNLAGAISGRGIIFRLMGRYEEALADFNRAIELNPDEGRALGNRSEPTSS